MVDFEDTIKRIKILVSKGGSSARWFAYAYVSWYRGGSRLVNLSGVECLDSENIKLFWLMINLRRDRNFKWCEETLYELEKYAIQQWRMDDAR